MQHLPTAASVFPSKVPNVLGMQREGLPREALAAFSQSMDRHRMYRIAARFWARHGMSWDEALLLAERAFSEE